MEPSMDSEWMMLSGNILLGEAGGKKITQGSVRKFVVHGDDIFGLGMDNAIWKTDIYGSPSNPKGWTKLTDGSVTDFVVYGGRIFGVGMSGAIWTHKKNGWGTWQKITSGTVSQFQIHDNKIYGLGTDNAIWEHPLDQHNQGWKRTTTRSMALEQ